MLTHLPPSGAFFTLPRVWVLVLASAFWGAQVGTQMFSCEKTRFVRLGPPEVVSVLLEASVVMPTLTVWHRWLGQAPPLWHTPVGPCGQCVTERGGQVGRRSSPHFRPPRGSVCRWPAGPMSLALSGLSCEVLPCLASMLSITLSIT